MNKINIILASLVIVLCFSGTVVLAATSTDATSSDDTSDVSELIQTLKEQVESLKAQIQELITKIGLLKEQRGEIKETTKEIKETLHLIRHLREGMTGDDVTLLQEILATDPEIYPKGFVTGYFGPLTKNAVKMFQKKAGIEQVGMVGPKTMAKINELLEYGAGASGKVPPGLLIAPGIIKKLGYMPVAPGDQILPPGIAKKLGQEAEDEDEDEEEEDTKAPVISEVTATSTTATSTDITWLTDEESDSKLWYDVSTPLDITTSTLTASSADLVLEHNLTISNLTASTTYYYIVSSVDEEDNIATSSEYSFMTLQSEE
jgi:peptidoglycan hydrolase-like protein with peptidoglycan-binding domain